MPVKLVCGGCGDETVYNPSSLQGTGWLQDPTLGGTRVLCPKCQTTDEDYLVEKETEFLIEIYVTRAIEKARKEAEEEYTPDYVRKLREGRINQLNLILGDPKELEKLKKISDRINNANK